MIKVGDRVRSYDFAYVDRYYIEGVVVAIGEWEHCDFRCGLDHIHILVDYDTMEDRSLVGQMVYPVHPDSGARGFFADGKASKVELI